MLGLEAQHHGDTNGETARLEACDTLHRAGGQTNFDSLTDELVGNRVVVAFDFDVVVDVDAGRLPRGKLIALDGQGLQNRPVERFEQAGAEPERLRNGRWLSRSRSSAMAWLSSARLVKRRWRSTARIQRSTSCAAASTLVLSRGCRGRHEALSRLDRHANEHEVISGTANPN